MVRLALFDIDGTLLHTGAAGIRAFAKVMETEFGVRNATAGLKFSGRTDTGLVRELFTRHGIATTPENFRRFFDAYPHWLDHLLSGSSGSVCPGVMEFIAAARALPEPPLFGLLTGNIRLGAEIKLRHFNLWDGFAMGAFGDDHEDRNQIAAIAHRRGASHLARPITGDEVLVIGDTPLDIACGQAIGARVLAVATGGAALAELQAHSPTFAVADLHGISAREALA